MSFLSFKFILFLSTAFFVYFITPKKYRWVVLLLFSYVYYFLNSRILVLVLLLESIITFGFGILLSNINRKIIANDSESKTYSKKEKLVKTKEIVTFIGIAIIVIILVYFKYTNFIISNINLVFNRKISFVNLALPIGLSFYTLQSISYIVDISKNKYENDKNILHFLLYMSYFPQILEGPIPRYNKLAKQLFEEHEFDYIRVTHGLQLMFWGIAKKVIIADRIAIPVNHLFDNYTNYSGLVMLFAAICYGFQIYADFSGGIDAIRGISEVFGIYLDDNFRQPYFSTSIEDFWRRWHITLGAWMKEYIFYPLSLSKRLVGIGKKARRVFGIKIGKKIAPFISMFIVYFLVGLWHGPNWKYIVYGIWNGLFIMFGILFSEQYKKIIRKCHINEKSKYWRMFQMIRTILIISIGRFFSRADNLTISFVMIKKIFIKPFDYNFLSKDALSSFGLDIKNWLLLLIGIIIIIFNDYLKEKGVKIRESIDNKNIVIRWFLYYSLIISILVFGLYGGEYVASSFIYQKF